ncbi:glycosyltransferase [Desulfoscipio sp. XC116]|uniref:glycosyltransferase n=1 Tax=Desulfoscipio sp. XC116 TaxID=3144975 RepID=UPI00325B8C99
MMDKGIFYCASTSSHILNFHLPYLQFFKEQGWRVDVAVAGAGAGADHGAAEIPYADNVLELPIKKNLLAIENLRAIFAVKRLIIENRYDIISAHTTLAGAVVRLAVMLAGKRRCGNIVYTSHGYFFNEKRRLSELPYLWVERLLAPVTDVLMVMNSVDHRLAKRYKLGKKITFIPGMGLDLSKFSGVSDKEKKKLKIAAGYKENDFLIVYAAEMSKRKNQGELIRAFALAAAAEPSLKLLLAGDGALKARCEKMAQRYGLNDRVCFLGHVSDMASLYRICDLAVSTSRSEGLPFNVMEAMACGLPVVASRIKGHTDLLGGLQERFLYNLEEERALTEMLLTLCRDEALRYVLGDENRMRVRKYGLELVRSAVINRYGGF